MQLPSVSVVMCTYNGSRFVDEQIGSILQQDYNNLNILIIDDNSTDDTWNKLLNWKSKNDKVDVLKNETNLGYNQNFEKAISLASGDLIAISDQDDIWMPTKISEQVATFRDKNVMLSHTRSVRLQDGRLRYKSASLHHHFSGNDTRKLLMFNQVNGHDMMFRKTLVGRCIPIPKGMMYDWWIALIATCYGTIASVDQYLVHHRIHSHNSYFTKQENTNSIDLMEALRIFTSLDCLTAESKSFLQQLLSLLVNHHQQEHVRFNYPFFKFLHQHRQTIFGHKKRAFPALAYLKYAYKYAKKDYRGKGLTI
jgi:glycosyltransferase involved in cell wall biosynthesis